MNLKNILATGAAIFLTPLCANAAITLSLPSFSTDIPANPADYLVDVTFQTGGSTSPLVGYDVAFTISGPTSDLSITGVSTGAARPANAVFADDPAFFPKIISGKTFYGVSDYLLPVTDIGTITDGSVLFELLLHANAGTTGDFHVDFVTDTKSPLNSQLYADADLNSVPALSLQGGTVTFANPVPEPSGLLAAGVSLFILIQRIHSRVSVRRAWK